MFLSDDLYEHKWVPSVHDPVLMINFKNMAKQYLRQEDLVSRQQILRDKVIEHTAGIHAQFLEKLS